MQFLNCKQRFVSHVCHLVLVLIVVYDSSVALTWRLGIFLTLDILLLRRCLVGDLISYTCPEIAPKAILRITLYT